MKFRLHILCVLCITAFSAVACMHPISSDVRKNLTPQLTFAQVSENPSAFLDRNLMLGGVIISHENKDGSSLLELMEWHINRWGEPTYLNDQERRFLVKSEESLDPTLYEPGTLVTLAGVVQGQNKKPLGEQQYTYPVLDLIEIHLWKSPFRYGIHHYDPAYPNYVGDESDRPDRHPYDPGYSGYPYTPYWYKNYWDSYR